MLHEGEPEVLPEYHEVPDEHVGLELDEYLCLIYSGVPKGKLRQEVREGRVLIDGERVEPGTRLRESMVLVMQIPTSVLTRSAPTGPSVTILYEDEHVLAVDKPAGLAVEPERWMREAGSMAGAMLALARQRTQEAMAAAALNRGPDADLESAEAPLLFRPRILHRLDKETSGVLLVAKDIETERRLRAAFEYRRISKTYMALVEGEWPAGPAQMIDAPIGPDERRSGRMRIVRGGKESQTEVELEQGYRGYSLVRCRPLTGRTHQIRVHLAHEGFPLVVDKLYGRNDEFLLSQIKRGYRAKQGRPERPLIDRLTLHAAEIVFPGPGAPEDAIAPMPFVPDDQDPSRSACGGFRRGSSPLPSDLTRLLKQLAKLRALPS